VNLDNLGDATLKAILDGETELSDVLDGDNGQYQPDEAEKAAGKKRKRLQGRELVLDEPEPWPEPVDGSELLAELVEVLRLYIVMTKEQATAVALWTVHTYLMRKVETYPVLAVTSATERSGKTNLFRLLNRLVLRPLLASNLTPAAIFRTVEKARPTLLVDEVDTFINAAEELRGILNSGHSRDAAYVVRAVGDDYEPRMFSTWSAKAVAMIGKLPATLQDRSVEIRLVRKRKDERVLPVRDKALRHFGPLRRKIARFAADIEKDIEDYEPKIPSSLNDRAADNWEPLLAIADLAGGGWPEEARKAALALSGEGEEEEARILLLGDLAAIFQAKGTDRLSTADILEQLHEMEDRPWPEWRHGRPLSSRGLARLLQPFGIKPKKIRLGEETLRGYILRDLQEVFSRYIPPQSGTSGTSQVNPQILSGTSMDDVPDGKQPLTCDVPHVPDRNPHIGEKGHE